MYVHLLLKYLPAEMYRRLQLGQLLLVVVSCDVH